MSNWRLDLHVHSRYSYDSRQSLQSLIRAVKKQRLDGIALTDHDVLEGALKLQSLADFIVIPGEEIRTSHGEITGLFLGSPIPPGLSPQETIARIHDQGGLVYIPHPLARGVPSRIHADVLEQLLPQVDILEGFNSRIPLPADDLAAQKLACRFGKALGAGSDAHFSFEVGRAWVDMEPFDSPQSFLASLRRGHIVNRKKTAYLLAGFTFSTKVITLMKRRLAAG
jgi:predicted metal-dependent phosphoesterase TrpH